MVTTRKLKAKQPSINEPRWPLVSLSLEFYPPDRLAFWAQESWGAVIQVLRNVLCMVSCRKLLWESLGSSLPHDIFTLMSPTAAHHSVWWDWLSAGKSSHPKVGFRAFGCLIRVLNHVQHTPLCWWCLGTSDSAGPGVIVCTAGTQGNSAASILVHGKLSTECWSDRIDSFHTAQVLLSCLTASSLHFFECWDFPSYFSF